MGNPKYLRPTLFILFVAGGLAIFLLGNNWNSLFPTNDSTLYKWGLVAFFLLLTVGLLRSARYREYWPIPFGLLEAAFANAVNWQLGNWLGRLLPPPSSAMQDFAIDKLSQAIPIVLALLVLTWLAGHDLGSIFLQKGDWRWGLRFGLISFGVCALIFSGIAVLQAGDPSSQGLTASGVSLATILSAIPWIILFIFANSIMEELWFRGIFLKKLNPFLGMRGAVFATALVFGIPHLGGTYITPAEMLIFPLIVVGLGLVNGIVMQKTDSIWGSLLFHAGYDLFVIIPLIVAGG